MKRSKNELPGEESVGYRMMCTALEDLGNCWMYSPEFRNHYNISDSTLARYAHRFPDHQFIYRTTRIWSGDPETIRSLKERLNA